MIRCSLFHRRGIRNQVIEMLIDGCETVKEYDVLLDLTNADVIICKKDETPEDTLYLGTIYPETYGMDRIKLIADSICKEYQDFEYLDKFYNDVKKVIWDFRSRKENFITKTQIVSKYGSKYVHDVAYYESFHGKAKETDSGWITPTIHLYIKPIIEYYYNKKIDKNSKKAKDEIEQNCKK